MLTVKSCSPCAIFESQPPHVYTAAHILSAHALQGDLLSLPDSTYIKAPSVPETFLVSAYPTSTSKYWLAMMVSGAQIGLQFEHGFGSYHLVAGQVHTFEFGSVELKKTTMLLPDGSLLERTYILTDLKGNCREFIHYSLKWDDFDVPNSEAFAELMLAYRNKIESLQAQKYSNITVHVHCRAGMGRSGTFLFSRTLACQPLQSLYAPSELLDLLRKQRPGLIDTELQSAFAMASVESLKIFDQMKFIRNRSLGGRICWIRKHGALDILPLWQQWIIWVANLVSCKQWMLRRFIDLQEATQAMIDLRERISPLLPLQPELAHRYWECWQNFENVFSPNASNIQLIGTKAPSTEFILASRYLLDIESLLSHSQAPTAIARTFLEHGLLGQALWIIQNRKCDEAELEKGLSSTLRGWLYLQACLKQNKSLEIEQLADGLWTDLDGNTWPGLGLGAIAAKKMLDSFEKTRRWPERSFCISTFEMHQYLSLVIPTLTLQWGELVSLYQKICKKIKELQIKYKDKQSLSEEVNDILNVIETFPDQLPDHRWDHVIQLSQDLESDPALETKKRKDPIMASVLEIVGWIKSFCTDLDTVHSCVFKALLRQPYVSPLLEEWLKVNNAQVVTIFPCALKNTDAEIVGFHHEQGHPSFTSLHKVTHVMAAVIATYFQVHNAKNLELQNNMWPRDLAIYLEK